MGSPPSLLFCVGSELYTEIVLLGSQCRQMEIPRMSHPPIGSILVTELRRKGILWTQISALGPQRRAANLLPRMTEIARKVYMPLGRDHIGSNDGFQQISRILRGRFAPDALDSNYQDVVTFPNFKRAVHTKETYLMEFGTPRETAESRVVMGRGFPDEFARAHCVRNAAFPKNEKSLALARIRKKIAFPVARSRTQR